VSKLVIAAGLAKSRVLHATLVLDVTGYMGDYRTSEIVTAVNAVLTFSLRGVT
jgi:hypothetical protein